MKDDGLFSLVELIGFGVIVSFVVMVILMYHFKEKERLSVNCPTENHILVEDVKTRQLFCVEAQTPKE